MSTTTKTNKPQKKDYSKDERYILYKSMPFVNRKMTFTKWLEKNSFAAMFTFLLFIFGFVTLVSIRIKINTVQLVDGVMIDMPITEQDKPVEEEIPEDKKAEMLEIERMVNVRNRVADANADNSKQTDRSKQLLEEAQAVQDKLDANKAAYEKGLNEVKNMSGGNARKSNTASDASQESKRLDTNKRIPAISKQGNVTVEYDLPGRYATVLPVPAYKCEDGGKVIISIVVNNNGDVINASVKASSSSKTDCIATMALDAAKKSRFDVNAKAVSKQEGTITYLFLAQ
ncbi:MAG: TonB family protein [Rikenellaceae bacterium]